MKKKEEVDASSVNIRTKNIHDASLSFSTDYILEYQSADSYCLFMSLALK